MSSPGESDPLVVGVDVGGTKIIAGAVRGTEVIESVERPTDVSSGETLLGAIEAAVREFTDRGEAPTAVGLGVPSQIDFAAGRILNEKTATSQAKGGIIYAIGSALMEAVIHDHASGRLVNANLFDYHIPVNADIPSSELDVVFIDDGDTEVNLLGAKGIGEIVSIGVPAAIANAVFHATGKRVRELPLTPDKLL